MIQEEYEEYIVEYYSVNSTFHISSRFFYLKHYMLFANGDNYKSNPVFYFYLITICSYFIIILVYNLVIKAFYSDLFLINGIKQSVINQCLPYTKNNYNINNILNLEEENEIKLTKSGKNIGNKYERNLGIKDVNVEYKADKISKFGKKYKDKNNNIDLIKNSDYYAKETKVTIPSRYTTEEHFFTDKNDNDNNKDNKEKNKFFNQSFNDIEEEEDNINLPNPPKKYSAMGTTNTQDISFDDKKEDNNVIDNENENENEMKSQFFGKEKQKKNKSKRKNYFHKNYDEYEPNYEKPKVISTRLPFFIGDDDSSNIIKERNLNLTEKINYDINEKDYNEQMNFNIYPKNVEVNLDDKLSKHLPNLEFDLKNKTKLLEYFDLNISSCEFLKTNLSNRYLFLTLFDRISIFYSKYQRFGVIIGQYSLYAFILSILFILDEKQEIINIKINNEIFLFILYIIVAEIISCILSHLPAFMFYINLQKMRNIYATVKEDRGIYISKQYDHIIKERKWWNIFGLIIIFIYIFLGFYFSFGFCAVYIYQRSTFILCLILTIISDFLLWEFLWELFLCFLYSIRNSCRCMVIFGEFLNRMKFMKNLV